MKGNEEADKTANQAIDMPEKLTTVLPHKTTSLSANCTTCESAHNSCREYEDK